MYEFALLSEFPDHPYIQRPHLKERGWTGKMIDDLLGDPDKIRRSGKRKQPWEKKYYLVERVLAAEESPRFTPRVARSKGRPSGRTVLAKRNGKRMRFTAVVERFGKKTGYIGDEPTLLLRDIRFHESGEQACDHLWMNLTKGFASLDLKEGDRVAFDARVTEYEKGYRGHRIDVLIDKGDEVNVDYKLSHPTRIERTRN